MDSLDMVEIALAPVVEQRDELQKLNDEASTRIAELGAELSGYEDCLTDVNEALEDKDRHIAELDKILGMISIGYCPDVDDPKWMAETSAYWSKRSYAHLKRADEAEAKMRHMCTNEAYRRCYDRAEKAESEYLEQAKRADEQMERCMEAEKELSRVKPLWEAHLGWIRDSKQDRAILVALNEMEAERDKAREVCRDIIAVVESDGAMSVQGIYEAIEKAKAALNE